jgi:hypothetical protein
LQKTHINIAHALAQTLPQIDISTKYTTTTARQNASMSEIDKLRQFEGD